MAQLCRRRVRTHAGPSPRDHCIAFTEVGPAAQGFRRFCRGPRNYDFSLQTWMCACAEGASPGGERPTLATGILRTDHSDGTRSHVDSALRQQQCACSGCGIPTTAEHPPSMKTSGAAWKAAPARSQQSRHSDPHVTIPNFSGSDPSTTAVPSPDATSP